MELLLDLKAKSNLFFTTLREYSMSKDDPIPEWEVIMNVDGDGSKTCICSTPILHEFMIKNKHTDKTLIIGSECVKRWNLSFTCDSCGSSLGNVTKRLLKKDKICPDCKKILRQQNIIKEAQRQERIQKLGSYILFWYGPYYNRRFSQVIEDIDYTEYLINLDYKTKTLEYFEEYANLIYDIEKRVIETGREGSS